MQLMPAPRSARTGRGVRGAYDAAAVTRGRGMTPFYAAIVLLLHVLWNQRRFVVSMMQPVAVDEDAAGDSLGGRGQGDVP